MGAVLGLCFGIGLTLVWLALSGAPRARPTGRLRAAATELLRRAGLYGVSPILLVAVSSAVALVVGLLVLAVSGTAPVALLFAAAGGYLPVAMLRGRARQRQRELADVWPEAVDNLASAVRAGLSLPEALAQLGERGPEPLREPFTAFGTDYTVTGRFGDCLDRVKLRLSDPVGDRVVEALRVAREVGGGDLGRMLRSLSSFLRDDSRTRSELESRQSWTVNGARLAVSAPWLVLLFLSFQQEVIRRYSSPEGVVVLVTGAVLCLVAYRLMVRIGRLPDERRVLS
ncbi:MAG TPA: type II secretion system F family protein [Nocardioidaceae bacterium]|nr:type II secretion system F family protein [Nocardioidaceae bacterium]